jgi:hypothetical protein
MRGSDGTVAKRGSEKCQHHVLAAGDPPYARIRAAAVKINARW